MKARLRLCLSQTELSSCLHQKMVSLTCTAHAIGLFYVRYAGTRVESTLSAHIQAGAWPSLWELIG